MREPALSSDDEVDATPFSRLPSDALRDVLAGYTVVDAATPEYCDLDFRRRYAAILLAERGQ